jgi:hypothetical protein
MAVALTCMRMRDVSIDCIALHMYVHVPQTTSAQHTKTTKLTCLYTHLPTSCHWPSFCKSSIHVYFLHRAIDLRVNSGQYQKSRMTADRTTGLLHFRAHTWSDSSEFA